MKLITKKTQQICKLAAGLCAFTLLAPVTALAADRLSYSYLQECDTQYGYAQYIQRTNSGC
ncbi:hypothetical protein tinsulaeT_36970 [Thalassotalea insulae]|uniref:Uncharacterized protein n=1 Tax=Thalassotalea insulae TaxID=2056778 RepID=A0ABQ6H0L0_9GAMM|nr:hypothetical protein tinsulaeT_36970 [Thalassotalea insulae]